MMNHYQHRILAEAVKYGGTNTSKIEQMAKLVNEEPVLTGGEAAPTLFGWSKHQFEAKFRELLTRMGFERGIIHTKTEGQEMKMYFANAAKARDFVVAFNGLARRKSMGSVASVATQFNKIKSPTGTNAIVSLDLTMVRGESLDLDGTDLYEWFSEETETITEGGVKAALADFMEGLPKEMVAEIKKIIKLSVVNPTEVMKRKNKIEAIRKKYKIAPDFMGTPTWKIIVDYFNTFHGESVEVVDGDINEAKKKLTSDQKAALKAYKLSCDMRDRDDITPDMYRHYDKRAKADAEACKKLGLGKEDGVYESVHEDSTQVIEGRIKQHDSVYFDSYTTALAAARAKAEKKGYEIDEEDWASQVTHGYPGRPSVGKTTNKKINLTKNGKPVKPRLIISVYGMKNQFELTSYISESVEVNEENLNIGTYGFRLDRDSGKFVLYQLSYNRGSVRFPDGRTGTVIGRYATRDEAIAAAKRNAGVKEEVSEGVRMMAGVEKMLKDEGHPTMVGSLRNTKKSLEGKPTGSVMVLTKEKSPESMEIKIYEPSDFASMTKGLTKKAEAKVGSKGSWSGGEVTVIAIKEEVEQIEEAKMLTGPGKKDPKRLVGIYTMQGKWIKDMNSEAEAKAFVNKSWGESIEEDGEELTEAQQVIGKYLFTSFVEGSLKGWLISVQNKGEVGFIEEPAKKNTRTSIAPHKVFFNTKQQGNPKLVLTLFPDSTTRFVGDKEMRFAPRQLLKAVAMWMDKYGYEKIEHAKKEEVQVDEDGEEITEY